MIHTLAYIVGVLIFIAGIGLSVALHELGHMLPAKAFGVKVPEYFLGFGPRLWSTRIGETEYGIKAIWLGGYVRLLGMLPPAPAGRPDKPGSAIAQAREESLAELGQGEEDRAFYRLSVPRKLVVMAGGICTNLVLGVALLALAMGVIGQPGYTTTLSHVESCVSETGDASGSSAAGDDGSCALPSPGATAGLQPGDEIVSWDGVPMHAWADIQAAIADGGHAAAQVHVRRAGEELTLTLTPVVVDRPLYSATGEALTNADGTPQTQARPYVGIAPSVGTVRVPIGQIAPAVGETVVGTLRAILTIPTGLYHAVAAGLGHEQRSAEGLVSVVGIGRIAGEVTSAGAGTNTVTLAMRASSLLSLLGSLNVALFAFNLIPLLPLDGGHVAGACWEGIRRLWGRAHHRPDPGPVDTARLLPVGQVVVVILVAVALVLIWVDLVAPI